MIFLTISTLLNQYLKISNKNKRYIGNRSLSIPFLIPSLSMIFIELYTVVCEKALILE